VPDTYQGCEVVALSLVDPDNRREVDWDALEKRFRAVAGPSPAEPVGPGDLDEEKLLVTALALAVRRELPECFADRAAYEPLPTSTEHALGFVRSGRVAALAIRAPGRLLRQGGWADDTVTLPDGSWRDELTGATWPGGEVSCAGVLGTYPVALLVDRRG
jgi:(1->4)-alpha-D-glucan 1-alpha-D-glucosylmutase